MGTVATFRDQISSQKLLQSTYYKVSFTKLPGGIGSDTSFFNTDFDIFCQGTDIPGKKLGVIEVKRHGFTLRMPGNMEYDGTWKTTVLMDLSLKGYKKLLEWVNVYSNWDTEIGGDRGFPSGTATIQTLDNNYKPTTDQPVITIYGIFPTDVPALAMKQDASDYLNVDVTFAYSYTDDFGVTGSTGNVDSNTIVPGASSDN